MRPQGHRAQTCEDTWDVVVDTAPRPVLRHRAASKPSVNPLFLSFRGNPSVLHFILISSQFYIKRVSIFYSKYFKKCARIL